MKEDLPITEYIKNIFLKANFIKEYHIVETEIKTQKAKLFQIKILLEQLDQIEKCINEKITVIINSFNQKDVIEIEGFVCCCIDLTVKDKKIYKYELHITHEMFILGLQYNCLVFKELTIKQIITKICENITSAYKVNINNSTKYTLFQYNESNLNFLYRIFNLLGISFFYQISDKTMIFHDNYNCYEKYSLDDIDEKLIIEDYKIKKICSISTGSLQIMSRKKWAGVISKKLENEGEKKIEERLFFPSEIPDNSDLESLIKPNLLQRNIQFTIEYNCPVVTLYSGRIINDEEVIFSSHLIFNKKTTYSIIKTNNKDSLTTVECSHPQNKYFIANVCGEENEINIDDQNMVEVLPLFEADEKNTILVRLANNVMAGPKYGSSFIPRGGMEVLCVFVDELLSSGCLISSMYNEQNIRHTKNEISGLKNETVKKMGNIDETINDNSILFDDTEKNEKTLLSGRKDINIQTNELLTISAENKEIEIKKDYTLNAENINIMAKKKLTIEAEDIIIKTKTIKLEATQFEFKADKIDISVADAKIELKKAAIEFKSAEIKSVTFEIKASASLNLKSALIDLSADGVLKTGAKTITIDGNAAIVIKAPATSITSQVSII